MRLARFLPLDGSGASPATRDRSHDGSTTGRPRCGVVDGDVVVPVADGSALVAILATGEVPDAIGDPLDLATVRLLAPVGDPPSIRDFYAFEAHVKTAREARGVEMDPDWYELPVFYFTNPAAVYGPGDKIPVPATEALDYELEVAAIVGREVRGAGDAGLDAICGFTVMNDWSARDLQRREMRQGLGPAKGKDFATSFGPVAVTPDELPGGLDGRPQATMVARVNGEEWSRGELGDLHWSWTDLVAYAARDTRLRPGDLLGSGTVGTGCILELSAVHGEDRYRWLRPGDVVELEVAGIGTLTNVVSATG